MNKDRLPPHSSSAEAAVLGCCLLDPKDSLPLVIGTLKYKTHFYDLRHQIVFSAMTQLYESNKPVDVVSLHEHLKASGELEKVGGDHFIATLSDASHSASNLPYYLEVVKEKADIRKIVRTCAEVTDRIYNHNGSLDELKFSVQSDLGEIFGNGTGGLPEIIDATTFLSTPLKMPDELIAGVLHRGSKLAFGGSSKSFKTWCLLDLAISVATGTPFLGLATTKGKVLFVNFEIAPHAWQRRIASVAAAKGVRIDAGLIHVWNLRGHASNFRRLIPKIIQRARTEGFALIILDPIYKLYGATDENAAGDVADLLNSMESLAVVTGAAVAYGCHFAKGNAAAKEAIDRISGSGVFARDPDSLLIFTKHETEGAFVIEPILRNFPPIEPFVVRWNFPLMEPDVCLDPSKLKQAAGRKSEFNPDTLMPSILSRDESNPISISEWAELANVPRRTLSDYIPQLREKGWIFTVGEGTRSKQAVTSLAQSHFK